MSLRRRRGLGDLVAVNLMSTPFVQEPEEAIETYALDPAGLVSESEALVLELVKEASAEDEAAEVVEAVDAAAEAAAANTPSGTSTSNGLFAVQPAAAAPGPLPGSALPAPKTNEMPPVTGNGGKASADASSVGGVPWWGWALGGVAALGLVVLVAKKKNKKRDRS